MTDIAKSIVKAFPTHNLVKYLFGERSIQTVGSSSLPDHKRDNIFNSLRKLVPGINFNGFQIYLRPKEIFIVASPAGGDKFYIEFPDGLTGEPEME